MESPFSVLRTASPYALNDTQEAALRDIEQLLREAHTRLMVSEGDSRYENANIALALRIAEVVDVE